MGNIFTDITETVGRTPLVRLNRLTTGLAEGTQVLVKLEFFNPANSVKDRIGVAIIDAAEASGELPPGGTIVEATSGNTGIALAMVAAARGYHAVLAMPESMSTERRALLRLLGAELVLTPASQGMQGAIDAAQKIVTDRQGAVLARQFTNEANWKAHYATTGPEIWADTDGAVDALVAGVGTGGTLTGAGRYLRQQKPDISVFAVEPTESPVLAGGQPGPHAIQGIGANFVPDVLDTTVYDEVVHVDAPTAIATARRAAAEEGLLVGISAGANIAAALQIAGRAEFAGKTIVTMGCDLGERYQSTALFEDLIDE